MTKDLGKKNKSGKIFHNRNYPGHLKWQGFRPNKNHPGHLTALPDINNTLFLKNKRDNEGHNDKRLGGRRTNAVINFIIGIILII